MKRILFTGLLTMAISSCNMKDQIAHSQIPSVVLDGFQQQYSEAIDVEWEKQDSNFEAEFDLEKVDYAVLLNQQGEILKTKHDVNLEEVPEDVVSKIKVDYPDYTIDDVEILEEGGTRYFQVELNGNLMGKDIVVSESGEVLDTKYWD